MSFVKTKIITNENDKVGFVLFGCKDGTNSLNLKNIHVLYSLSEPDAIKLETKITTFTDDHGDSKDQALVVAVADLRFSNGAIKSSSKLKSRPFQKESSSLRTATVPAQLLTRIWRCRGPRTSSRSLSTSSCFLCLLTAK